jgi:hypothetical protein
MPEGSSLADPFVLSWDAMERPSHPSQREERTGIGAGSATGAFSGTGARTSTVGKDPTADATESADCASETTVGGKANSRSTNRKA